MAQRTPMPRDLWRWVTGHLHGADHGTDVSWPRGNSMVWKVASGPDTVFVKVSPSSAHFAREVAGYGHAARALGVPRAPRLLAANPELPAILSSPVPGRVVRDLPLETSVEREVHEQAGRLLRRWHDHSDTTSSLDRQAICAAVTAQADEAGACLERTTGHLDGAARALVQCAAIELPCLAEEMPVVYRHGDHATRNWLWDPEHAGVGIIDFETAGHGIAAEEFVWLYAAVWPQRPDLKDAHFTGYGRPLSDAEERFLLLLTVRLGVSYLATGLAKGRPDLVERGTLVLERMARQDR